MAIEKNPDWYDGDPDSKGKGRHLEGTAWARPPAMSTGSAGSTASPGEIVSAPKSLTSAKPQVLVVGDREIGSLQSRALADLVDSVIFGLTALTGMFVGVSSADLNSPDSIRRAPLFNSGAGIAVGVVVTFACFVASIAVWGTTPGKRVLNLEIVRNADGERPGLIVASLRNAPVMVGGLLAVVLSDGGPVALCLALYRISNIVLVSTDLQRQSIGDRIARTYVVRRR
jgi:uncharacterized RDD family membrane protein YckC